MDRNGYAAVFICLLMPLLLALAGICIDGAMLMYYEARLASATKFAAISATAFFEIADEEVQLIEGQARTAAETALEENFSSAEMVSFEINDALKSSCTVRAKVDVEFFFARLLHFDRTTIEEVYTAERILK